MTDKREDRSMTGDTLTLDVSDITLDDVEQMDDSVLAGALRRLHQESENPNRISMHTNKVHTNSYSSSAW